MLLNNLILKNDVLMPERHRYGPVLESVITITEDLAFQQAKEADQVLAKGKYMGKSAPSYFPLVLFHVFHLHILVFGCHEKNLLTFVLVEVRCPEEIILKFQVN